MDCSDGRPLLQPLWDGALKVKDSALVINHLQSCEQCRCEWNYLEQLHCKFHDAKDKTQLPEWLMKRIFEMLGKDRLYRRD
jgi:predicted anti-sigma-YlaC factor YlaD